MPELPQTLLLVEDDRPQRQTLAGFLRKQGYQVLEAGSAAEAEDLVGSGDVDLLLTDLRLGGMDGVTLLERLRRRLPHLQALVFTAYGTIDDAVRAMRAGAYDFLQKPLDLERLQVLVEKALEKVELQRENRSLRELARAAGAFSELVGDSEALRRIKELALKLSATRATVLILGESGTGKEVLARTIHRHSSRRDRPFVVLNCAALPESLVEAELFGHEKGAFTGATGEKKGRFELADGGTLFLDEVGDIPLPVQVKLLGFLQSACFERVGGTSTIQVDVRLIAATHRDLREFMGQGRFREDLYYRINVVSVTMPPLREHREDIPLLVNHFLRKHRDLAPRPVESVAPEVLQRLSAYEFPGNVRELENMVERALALAEGSVLEADDFPLPGGRGGAAAPGDPGNLEQQVARLEIDLINAALRRHGGNKSAAARELGLSERAIRYKMKKYSLV